MQQVDQLIMIIPVILNLKGNLEMNLSARLGTAANIGDLDIPDKRRRIILGNLSLLQLQAAVVSFVAACVSYILGLIVYKLSPASPTTPDGNDVTPSTNVTMHVVHGLNVRRPRPHLPVIDDDKKSGLAE
jgi:solute carrier family 41